MPDEAPGGTRTDAGQGGGPERRFGIAQAVADDGEVVATMPSGPHLAGPAGLPPGGALGVLIDNSLGLAMILSRPASLWSVSAQISLDLCRTLPSDGSPIIARARNVHASPHAGFAMGTVTDQAGRLLATCRQHGRWVTTMPPGGPVLAGQPQGTWPGPEPAQPQAGGPAGGSRAPAADLAALLGARVQLTEGGARLELDVTGDVTNPLGNLHGGVTFAACDVVAQAAIAAAGGPVATASIHVAYPRPVAAGTTPRFDARVIHRGRVLGVVEVRVTVDGDRPCVIATVTTGVPEPGATAPGT
ncbi:MAG TPA: PaaI family thioesterase [Trebonia sp.]|nr:PaaI family thioesterase [Trebonia sp.]